MGVLAVSFPHEHAWKSVGQFWSHYVPSYQSGVFRPLFARIPFEGIPAAARDIRRISEKRSTNRIANYVIESETERVRGRDDFSIRFGVQKPGHGYSGKRGDFCLVAATYSSRTLTLFYRSIELMGGFAYDLVLIDHVCREIGIEPKFVEIWAKKAFKFALKGNSNEKLYPKLREIFDAKRVRETAGGIEESGVSGVSGKRRAKRRRAG
jgi:hypothetical protein